ncbi:MULTISPECIES: hypothetical protein [Legionella]|uniref:hypothetical protein n=1 Tax=Legionella TaxID=445 RepID=UPI00095AF05C|nr:MULTISPECIES: hypothetical protein [Legionella]MBN9225753.1 hypothetical protein [Legionella steelei]OJW10636.1 MAG: hypothetical protein BGO44_05575 [Legionella sp. 39-23]
MVENYIANDQLPYLTDKKYEEYVCWLDLMGTKSLMERSPTTCTIKICQLHNCLSTKKDTLGINNETLKIYPVMDGAFITSKNQSCLKKYLNLVFNSMAKDFIETERHLYQSIIRACIAYGPLGHGSDIKSDKISGDYKKTLLFGLPMTQAYSSEKKAPPFGIYVDKSARAFSPSSNKPFTTRWHIWFESDYNAEKLMDEMKKLYNWAREMSFCLPYNEEVIELHEKSNKQYLSYYINNPPKQRIISGEED